MTVGGRAYARVYNVSGRQDLHAFLVEAVEASGGRVLYASDYRRAPIYLGVQGAGDERIGLLVYPFRMSRIPTQNRPPDESKGQIRYGSETAWHEETHPVGLDVAGVDTTMILGLHLEDRLLVGLDPSLYDPLPMGISFYAKDERLTVAARDSWHVWERLNRPGSVREAPRAQGGLETLVAFRPERLLDYARFQRQASDLALDQPLRFVAAQAAGQGQGQGAAGGGITHPVGGVHALERDFELSSREILEIIAGRNRLAVAVRGGVAEHHLEKVFRADPSVVSLSRLDRDAQPDFEVTLQDGRTLLVECKNASPQPYADGAYKVEVQKTRASKGDPASRLYRTDQFDVVAACLYPPTRRWTFRYRATSGLGRHGHHPGRLAPMQRIDQSWSSALEDAL
jgi:hypothetical protein